MPEDQTELRRVTYEQQEMDRRERLSEVGTEMPCPFCKVPRVKRSDYIRCNGCGINWLDGENLMRNPKAERWEKLLTSARAQSTRSTDSYRQGQTSGAPTVESSTK